MTIKPVDVDQYLESGCGRCELGGTPQCKVRSWVPELEALRKILLDARLTEAIKWGAPCYMSDGSNIGMLSALKESVVFSFFRGAELADPEGILEKPGDNSRFAKYARFTDLKRIHAMEPVIRSYVAEAVALEQSGKPRPASDDLPDYPEELLSALEESPELFEAWEALTPGRKRGYLLHFNGAKQSATRANRIAKFTPKILAGKGWSDY